MSRSSSWYGLNERAEDIVKPIMKKVGVRHIREYFYDGKEFKRTEDILVDQIQREILQEIGGYYTDFDGVLMKYTFPDGMVIVEFVQLNPWDSGPMYFTALKHEGGSVIEDSLWKPEDLASYVGGIDIAKSYFDDDDEEEQPRI